MSDSVEDDKARFLKALELLGRSAGNVSLRSELGWPEDKYWQIHGLLADDAKIVKGRGRGGSISLQPEGGIAVALTQADTFNPTESQRELELYEPVKCTIESGWAKERSFDQVIVEITALPGRRRTGGTWTRPDIALLASKAYPYLPGRTFEVVTFEIKKSDSVDVLGVFEALSHAQFGSLSYVIYCTNGKNFDDDYADTDRIVRVAKQHGIGIIIAADIHKYDVWDERVEPRRNIPDPDQANLFIGTCFSDETKKEIMKWQK